MRLGPDWPARAASGRLWPMAAAQCCRARPAGWWDWLLLCWQRRALPRQAVQSPQVVAATNCDQMPAMARLAVTTLADALLFARARPVCSVRLQQTRSPLGRRQQRADPSCLAGRTTAAAHGCARLWRRCLRECSAAKRLLAHQFAPAGRPAANAVAPAATCGPTAAPGLRKQSLVGWQNAGGPKQLHAALRAGLPPLQLGNATSAISTLRGPPRPGTVTSSPTSLPIKARAIGADTEMRPCSMLASVSPTI